MTPVIDRLEHVRRIMIKIAANRSDGRNYIPIIQHLEKQIQMQRGADAEYLRILELASQQAA